MGNFYGELVIRITSDTAGLSKGLQSSVAQTNAASRSMQAAGKKAGIAWERVGLGMQNVGRTMTQFVTLPIAAGFAFATVSGYKYSKTLLQIRNLTGLTAVETERYGDAILGMSKYGIGPQKLAEAMYFVSSSGFEAAEAMKVLDVAAKASASGLGEVETVADVLTSAMNAYGHENLSAARATDILMKTIEVGKAEPEDLARSLGRIMPVAAKLGVPLEQVGGAIAGLTLTGLSSAEAVTALRGTMVALSAPAKMSIDELKTLGLSYQEVTRSIKDKGLLPTMQMLYEKTDGNMQSMRKIIPNVRALNGVLSLLGPNYKKNVEITDQVIASQGKLARAFQDTAETPMQKLRVAIADIQSSFIEMGIQIIPTVASVISKIAGMFNAIGSLSPGWRGAIMWTGAFVAALGPVIMIAGSFIRSVTLIKGALAGLSLIKSVSFAFSAFSGGAATAAEAAGLLVASLGPVAIAIAGIAAVGAVVYGLTKLTDSLDGTTERIGKMREAAEAVAKDDSLREWADRNLGGHLEASGRNDFVFKPRVEGDVNMLADWVKTAAAKAKVAERQEATRSRVELAADQRAFWEQEIHETRQKLAEYARPRGGAIDEAGKAAAQAYLTSAIKELKRNEGIFASQTAKLAKMDLKDKSFVYEVNIKEAKQKIKSVKKDLDDVRADLKKNPHNVNLMMKEERLQQRLERLQSILKTTTGKNYKIEIELEIKSAERDLKTIDDKIARIGKKYGGRGGVGNQYSPKITADISALLEKERDVKARIEKLNALKGTPTVDINPNPALTALQIIQAGINGVKGKTVSIIVNQVPGTKVPPNAMGGIYRESTIVEVGEDGPEVILPLSKPARMMELMGKAGLTGDSAGKAGSAVARKAAATGARVAAAVASAIGGALGGFKKKDTEKLANAADVSGSIQTLVDFIANISEALDALNKTTVPKLVGGWKTKIRAIVKQAAKVSNLIATELNKAFPWTKGKKGKGDAADVEPKMGKKGTAASHAAETSGPVQTLVDFVSSMVTAFSELNAAKLESGLAGLHLVVVKAKEIAKATRDIALAVSQAFAADAKARGGGSFTETISAAATAAVQMANDLIDIISSFAEVTEEGIEKAITGMKSTFLALVTTDLPHLIVGIAFLVAKAFKDTKVDEAVTSASSAATSLTSDLVGILGSFGQTTEKSVRDSIAGMDAVIAVMPGLTAGIIRIINAMQAALANTTVDEKLSETSSAVASIVGDVTGIISNLGAMTIEAVNNGIGGAYTVANRAGKLGIALTGMLDSLKAALGGIDAAGLTSLQDAMSVLASIAGSISSIVRDLAEMTIEKVTAATAAGSLLGRGFYEGLLGWHARIIALAEDIAADTAAALGSAQPTSPAIPPGGHGGGSSVAVGNQTVINDNSRLVINLPQGLSAPEAQVIARYEINAYEARKAKALEAARRGTVRG